MRADTVGRNDIKPHCLGEIGECNVMCSLQKCFHVFFQGIALQLVVLIFAGSCSQEMDPYNNHSDNAVKSEGSSDRLVREHL